MYLSQFSARLKPAVGDTTVIERVSGNPLTNAGTGAVAVVDRGAGDMCLRVTGGTMLFPIPASADYIAAGKSLVDTSTGSGDAGATLVLRVKVSTVDGAQTTTAALCQVGSTANADAGFGLLRYGSAGQALGRGNWIQAGASADSALSMTTERIVVVRMKPNDPGAGGLENLEMWITGGPGVGDAPDFLPTPSARSGATLSNFVANALGTNAFEIADAVLYRPTGTSVNLTNAQCASLKNLGIDAAIAADSPDTTAPIITGPTGAAGAASITVAIAEGGTAVGTWAANESVTWTKSGTDFASISIGAGTGVVALLSAGNFEAKPSYSFTVTATDGAGNARNQAVTLNLTNVNEAPVFAGPSISVPSGTAGSAITAIDVASRWTDPDSGDTGTLSKGGTWPSSVDLVGGQIVGTYPLAVGTVSGLVVNRTDVGGLVTPSNTFSITSTAGAAVGTITVPQLRNWAGNLLANEVVPNVVVVRMSDRVALAAFTDQAADISGDLTLSSPALPAGTACMVLGFDATGAKRFARAGVVV